MINQEATSGDTKFDLNAFANLLKKDVQIFLEACEMLKVMDQDFPSIVKLLIIAGEKFTGSNAIDAARDWIDERFDAEGTSEWIEAGFWNPYAAGKLSKIGIYADEATAIADSLVYRQIHPNPINAFCNGDLGLETFVIVVPSRQFRHRAMSKT